MKPVVEKPSPCSVSCDRLTIESPRNDQPALQFRKISIPRASADGGSAGPCRILLGSLVPALGTEMTLIASV